MEIVFHLKDHCIETEVKERYDELVKELLSEEDEEKEEKLEFVREFLEKSDFNELRSSGFDGSEEMFVKVKKENNDFSVKRVNSE